MDAERLQRIAADLVAREVVSGDLGEHSPHLPDRESVTETCRRLLALLFPGFFSKAHLFCGHADTYVRQCLLELEEHLRDQVMRARRFDCRARGQSVPAELRREVNDTVASFLERLPTVAAITATDVEAFYHNDPAAASREEIVAAYPGIEAIAVQRLAHELYLLEVPLIPRMMTEVAHARTGIDIHPGATIGESFAIDHGTGIVIGETTTIGKHCMLYHGVTLGAFNPLMKDDGGELKRGHDHKRHPDLEDAVIVYPGATILGGDTRIGHHSVIGGNVWLTQSVEPYSRVTIKDPELLVRNRSSAPGPDFAI